jgi:hypothetical protein
MSFLRRILEKSFQKPLKVDIRNVCEHNVEGPITRTFSIPRDQLIDILGQQENVNLIDRVDITEYQDESRCTLYSQSIIDHSAIKPLRDIAIEVKEWELEPQYGPWSAANINEAKSDNIFEP